MSFFISISRITLPIFAVIILTKCVMTLLLGHPVNKTYGYLVDAVNGNRLPLNMWETSIGRSNSCDISVGYDTVSRFQAVISRRIDGWYIFDTNSRAGTKVNGTKIDKRTVINDGDKLSFGDRMFYFVVSDDPVQQVGKKRGKKGKGEQLPPQQAAQGQQNRDSLLGGQAQFPQGQRPYQQNVPPQGQNPYQQSVPPQGQSPYQQNVPPQGQSPYQQSVPPQGQSPYQQNVPPQGQSPYRQSAPPQMQWQSVPTTAEARRTNAQNNPFAPMDFYEEPSQQPKVNREPALVDELTGAVYILCGNEVIIGRGRGSDISLQDLTVSRSHAVLTLFEEGWAVDDAGSKLGTTLNGKPVTMPQLLFDGDVIGISEYRLGFLSDYRNQQ